MTLCVLSTAIGPDEHIFGTGAIGLCTLFAHTLVIWCFPAKTFSATSVFSLACTMFVGLALVLSVLIQGELVIVNGAQISMTGLFTVGSFCSLVSLFSSLSAVKLLLMRYRRQYFKLRNLFGENRQEKSNSRGAFGVIGYISVLIFIVSAVFVELQTFPSIFYPLLYTSSLLICSVTLLSSISSIAKLVIVSAVVCVYISLAFTGFGRIALVSLAISIYMIHCLARRRVAFKRDLPVAAALGVVFLWIGGQIRSGPVDYILQPFVEAKGLGSVFGLLSWFTLLVDEDAFIPTSLFPLALGDTFWKALVWLVPRELWPDKPLGFGAELAFIFQPEYAQFGHTLVVTIFGEIFYNFGLLGIMLLPFVLGPIFYRIDVFGASLQNEKNNRNSIILKGGLHVLLSTGVLDLVWGGLATFARRGGTRIILLILIWGITNMMSKPAVTANEQLHLREYGYH